MTTRRETARETLNRLVGDGGFVRLGWHLCGPGPARWGWGRYGATGGCIEFCGRTAGEALRRLTVDR